MKKLLGLCAVIGTFSVIGCDTAETKLIATPEEAAQYNLPEGELERQMQGVTGETGKKK